MEKEAQLFFEIIFPRGMIENYGISDAEANLLYSLWKEASPGTTKFKQGSDNTALVGLKSKGYIINQGDGLEITDKGKKVIREMVTNEPNSFAKAKKPVSYSEIKARTASTKRVFAQHEEVK
jgi:hypothetical protein